MSATVGEKANPTLTTQTAERVYRSLGLAAHINITLNVAAEVSLLWLPQETIIFEARALERNYAVNLAKNSRFLALEAAVLGRSTSGEVVTQMQLRDSWRIYREGQLCHADERVISGSPVQTAALNGGKAFASLMYIAPDCEDKLQAVVQTLGDRGGASCWNGKLIARLIATDGYELRQKLSDELHDLLEHRAIK